jgi:hypothetical protein
MEKGGIKLRARAKSTHTRVDDGGQSRYNLRRARSEARSPHRGDFIKTKVVKTAFGKTSKIPKPNEVTVHDRFATPWPKKKTTAILKDWTPEVPAVTADPQQEKSLKRITIGKSHCRVPFLPDLPQSTPRVVRSEQATPPEVPVNSPPLNQNFDTVDCNTLHPSNSQNQSSVTKIQLKQEIELKNQEIEKLKNDLALKNASTAELKKIIQKLQKHEIKMNQAMKEKNEEIDRKEKEVEKMIKENILLSSRLGESFLISGIHAISHFKFQIQYSMALD